MKKTIYQKLLFLFFAAMLLFTILSRVMDSRLVAKVSTGGTQRKTINSVLEGDAVIEAGDISLITSEDGYRIEKVFVMNGSNTTPDTNLFQYQLTSIEDARKQTQIELDKLLLKFEQAQLSAQITPSVSEEEISQLEVRTAEKELALAQVKYNKKQIEYEENIKFIEGEYQKKRDLAEDELQYQNKKSYRNNEQSYKTAKATRDKEVKDARREVKDAEKELDRLKKEEASEDELSDAQDKLGRAQTDLDDLTDEWADTLEAVENQITLDEDQAHDIASGWTSSQISLDDQYRLDLENEDKLIQDAEDEVEKAQSNLELSRQNMELSQKKDMTAGTENERLKKITKLDQKSLQIDIENKQLELTAIDNLLKQGGIIKAGLLGTVVKTGLEIGQVTTGTETIQIATGNFRIRGTFQKDGDITIKAGDNVAIKAGEDSMDAVIDVVDLSHDDQGEFIASVGFEDVAVGMTAKYTYAETSAMYDKVLPLGAIHKDLKGYYCLTVQENNGILGTEFTAARINLDVVFAGTDDVAVEGNLGDETRIITATDTIIQEGDRIRLVNDYGEN